MPATSAHEPPPSVTFVLERESLLFDTALTDAIRVTEGVTELSKKHPNCVLFPSAFFISIVSSTVPADVQAELMAIEFCIIRVISSSA
jgi:hypothetical protein